MAPRNRPRVACVGPVHEGKSDHKLAWRLAPLSPPSVAPTSGSQGAEGAGAGPERLHFVCIERELTIPVLRREKEQNRKSICSRLGYRCCASLRRQEAYGVRETYPDGLIVSFRVISRRSAARALSSLVANIPMFSGQSGGFDPLIQKCSDNNSGNFQIDFDAFSAVVSFGLLIERGKFRPDSIYEAEKW